LTSPVGPVFSSIRVITATVTVYPVDINLSSLVYSGLALDHSHQLNGAADSIEAQFAAHQDTLGRARTVPIITTLTGADNGVALLGGLLEYSPALRTTLFNPDSTDPARSI